MKRNLRFLSALACALLLASGSAVAADQEAAADKTRTTTQERVYGSQLMTQQERTEYRAKVRAAKTAEEREQIRTEHHTQMTARAKERGVTLPDAPPARGGGTGGGGMGSGGGMGAGRGR